MKADGEQVLLRIYLRATDQHRLEPVYQRLVRRARERELAGATVLHGIWGFGSATHEVPVIVEIIDAGVRVRDFLESVVVHEVRSGLVTLERAHVMLFRGRTGEAAEARM